MYAILKMYITIPNSLLHNTEDDDNTEIGV